MLTLALSSALLVTSLSPFQAPAQDVYLAAGLRGADADGRSTVVLRISGDRLSFAIRWNRVDTPTAAHIHLGGKGTDGAVKVDFFKQALPKSVLGVSGTATAEPALLKQLAGDPGGFYANLHTAAFPKGAVRGRFHRLAKPVDLGGVLHGSNLATLSSKADGAQEVQAADGKKRGDQDGAATWWLRPNGAALAYTATWNGLAAPTDGHVHKAGKGRNGAVVAGLFAAAKGLPANLTGVAGQAPVPREVVGRIAADPGGYYSNLHTTDFDGGAVRGQLSGAGFAHPRAMTADVLKGAQIYRCKGGAYVQFGVTAKLRRGIDHDFADAFDGPPQWIAPDGSAVRGKLVTKTPNGEGNIPELVLDARQSGKGRGLLAFATTILRLNTEGGVAPKGSCREGAQVKVPYGADYVYLG
ncbi:CHRD domain-containing protein [Nonomuraea sp. NPDC050790]|uniref:CHRD domain-containing protein n=1 Tax=Nonomuraea sp. NPDC050790 TaxID=3364371 RepID=UPI0037961B5F